MSLEIAIAENTAALRELMVYLKKAIEAASKVPEPEISVSGTLAEEVENVKFDKVKNDFATPEEFHKYAHDTLTVEMDKAAKYLEADAKKPVAEILPKVTADVLPVTESAAPVMQLTLAEVGLAITAAAKLDRAKVVRVLAEFGCMRGSDLTADQYADFVKALS